MLAWRLSTSSVARSFHCDSVGISTSYLPRHSFIACFPSVPNTRFWVVFLLSKAPFFLVSFSVESVVYRSLGASRDLVFDLYEILFVDYHGIFFFFFHGGITCSDCIFHTFDLVVIKKRWSVYEVRPFFEAGRHSRFLEEASQWVVVNTGFEFA